MNKNGLYQLINALKSRGTDQIITSSRIDEDNVGLSKEPVILLNHQISLTNSGTAAVDMAVLDTPLLIPKDGRYVIMIVIDTATTVSIMCTVGTKSYNFVVNGGAAVTANEVYLVELYLAKGDQINASINVAAGATVTGLMRVARL